MSSLAQHKTARLAGGRAHVYVGNRATFFSHADNSTTTTYTDPIKHQNITANGLPPSLLSVGKTVDLGHAPSWPKAHLSLSHECGKRDGQLLTPLVKIVSSVVRRVHFSLRVEGTNRNNNNNNNKQQSVEDKSNIVAVRKVLGSRTAWQCGMRGERVPNVRAA